MKGKEKQMVRGDEGRVAGIRIQWRIRKSRMCDLWMHSLQKNKHYRGEGEKRAEKKRKGRKKGEEMKRKRKRLEENRIKENRKNRL